MMNESLYYPTLFYGWGNSYPQNMHILLCIYYLCYGVMRPLVTSIFRFFFTFLFIYIGYILSFDFFGTL